MRDFPPDFPLALNYFLRVLIKSRLLICKSHSSLLRSTVSQFFLKLVELHLSPSCCSSKHPILLSQVRRFLQRLLMPRFLSIMKTVLGLFFSYRSIFDNKFYNSSGRTRFSELGSYRKSEGAGLDMRGLTICMIQ